MRRVLAAVVLLAVLAVPAAPVGAAAPQRLLAPVAECPGQTEPRAPLAVQERAMLCLTNAARQAAGRAPLTGLGGLDRAAARKSADILRCDEFSHEACGRDFTYWIERLADCRSAAENIAWGTGSLASPRSIFRSWMHSAGHRANILGPYREIGIGLRVGDLEGSAAAHVWTQNFGTGC
jgi:uncharacterized protein YkwD